MTEFNIHQLNRECKRDNTLTLIATKILYDAQLIDMVKEQELYSFLAQVTKTYKRTVEYHNDLHGADVMQAGYFMLTTCGLRQTLKLSKLDCLSFVMAAVCHDLGHDGYTNTYHVNAITRRAIDCNDVAV